MTDNTKDSMRADFAKAALQGLLGNPYWIEWKIKLARENNPDSIETAADWLKREIADDAIEIADEIINRLEQPRT